MAKRLVRAISPIPYSLCFVDDCFWFVSDMVSLVLHSIVSLSRSDDSGVGLLFWEGVIDGRNLFFIILWRYLEADFFQECRKAFFCILRIIIICIDEDR